jgi:putative transposase
MSTCADPTSVVTHDARLHSRRSIRLPGWDYSADGAYFLTVCVDRQLNLFGDIVDGKMRLNGSDS